MSAANRRRVGVEIEFGGVDIDAAVSAVATVLEADVDDVSEYAYLLKSPLHADPFRLEVDFRLLKEMSREEAENPNPIRRTAVDVLGAAASLLTPLELVSPPLEFGELPAMQRAVEALADIGAVGTQDSIAYAFGTHFNPSLVDFSAGAILAHLQAFLCLEAWLRERDQIDITRRFTNFANPFPKAYEQRVLPPDYEPSLEQLIDDYLADNPTRNRALDMLPLFRYLDEPRVVTVVDDDLVKARPTFHYRLPNSRVGDQDWSIESAWQDWLTVERIASDAAVLKKIGAERLDWLDARSLIDRESDWAARCDELIGDLE